MNLKKLLVISCMIIISSCDNKPEKSAAERDNILADSAATKIKTILFFGNSLTAGYGLSPAEAFPALIQAKVDSLGLNYTVINAGVSGETSAGGNSRIAWILKQEVDVFVLELGANDGLRGTPVEETRKNLQSIIDKVRTKNPDVKIILAGMQLPPNMGQKYTTEFKDLFPELAQKNNIPLIPFILKDVGGEEKLNQSDGIHPTAEGHKIIANNIWDEIKKSL